VGIPQCAERIRDVQVAVCLGEDAVPDVKTIYGGVEKDFAHSNATFGVIKAQAEASGLQILGQGEWLLNDTTFSTQVRDMKRANPDVVAISAHPFTTCGVLKEMQRQASSRNCSSALRRHRRSKRCRAVEHRPKAS